MAGPEVSFFFGMIRTGAVVLALDLSWGNLGPQCCHCHPPEGEDLRRPSQGWEEGASTPGQVPGGSGSLCDVLVDAKWLLD